MRENVTLQCGGCKRRNYVTTKNKKTTTGKLEFSKYCRFCRKHTDHKEKRTVAARRHEKPAESATGIIPGNRGKVGRNWCGQSLH
jgi:large subunit ribosomal protein L33